MLVLREEFRLLHLLHHLLHLLHHLLHLLRHLPGVLLLGFQGFLRLGIWQIGWGILDL